jgi:sugar O-acyltransferase (sialic acid O-acetyltransferase NeuD family)
MSEAYVMWGSGGHAKVLGDLLRRHGHRVVALFDNSCVASAIAGVQVYVGREGFERWFVDNGETGSVRGAVAIGSITPARLELLDLFEQRGIAAPPLVHPDASVSDGAALARGSQVLAGAVVAADATVGDGTIINHRASVDHEALLGKGTHIAPGATLCGCVTVGDHVFVGAGAVVLPRVRIGDYAVIGAGAVVTGDVAPRTTVVGIPARCSATE